MSEDKEKKGGFLKDLFGKKDGVEKKEVIRLIPRTQERHANGAHLPNMLRWSVILLVIAIIAAVFAFGGSVSTMSTIARALFLLFMLLFLLSLLAWNFAHRKH